MLDISAFQDSLDKLGTDMDKKDLIRNLKEMEKSALEQIRTDNLAPWTKRKGRDISHLLSAVKDAVILKVIEFVGGVPQGISVLAVGGYGRDEMSPYSDIDILVIHEPRVDPKKFANALFYILWDLDYKLGNSVRTVKNIIEHSKEDITLLTALFETRLLAGTEKLRNEMYKDLYKALNSRKESYIREKLVEFHEISKKTAYAVLLKEPNLKENPGGLRSVHLSRWAYFAFFGEGGMEPLKKLLPSILYKKLATAYDYILYIRNMLHFIHRRKEDTLFIDYHQEVASHLGLKGDDYQKVMRMMHKIYNKAMDIFLISSHALDLIYFNQKKGFKKKLTEHTYLQDNELFVQQDKPLSIMEALDLIQLCTENQYLYSYTLIDYLRRCANIIKPEDRKSREIFNRFLDIISLPNGYEALNLMKLSNFLYKYIKYFGRIRHFIIYNPFHKFTVDEHSLEAIWALERLTTHDYNSFDREKVRDLIPLAEKHKEALWIVKLALLFHDIGKAWPGEHTRNGVEIADLIFEDFPVSFRYRSLIKFLIKNHLLLTHITRRSDIQSQEVILDLVEKFTVTPYPQEYLDYLYLLTYSDVLATNPTNYTGYVAALLRQLYNRTREVLSNREALISDKDYMEKIISEAKNLSQTDGIEDFIQSLGIRYASVNTAEEIIKDYLQIQKCRQGNVSISVSNFNEVLQVKIFSPDRLGLFAQLAGILLINGANIIRANIYTYQDSAFDVFFINDIFGANLTRENMQAELDSWVNRVQESVLKFLEDDPLLKERVKSLRDRVKPLPDIFLTEGAVNITHREGHEYLLGVSGSDRPGLLFDVCRYLSTHAMTIRSAIIDTIGWHIKDVFVVDTGRSLSEQDWEEHRNELLKLLNQKI